MSVTRAVQRFIESVTGYTVQRARDDRVYNQDGLRTVHSHAFMKDPAFAASYQRAEQSGQDDPIHWRTHIALWAAETASKLQGDFVECGVNFGFQSTAIMQWLEWNGQDRTFYLLDTFSGLDFKYVSEFDLAENAEKKNADRIARGAYVTDIEVVRKNFAEWKNVVFVQGAIPETLPQVEAEEIAFLHIDMNCSPPEVAALDFFWERLCDGAIVLLDDYAYAGHDAQRTAMDDFAVTKGVAIASLPPGQGLLLRPPK